MLIIFEFPTFKIQCCHLESTPMCKPIFETTSFFFCKHNQLLFSFSFAYSVYVSKTYSKFST